MNDLETLFSQFRHDARLVNKGSIFMKQREGGEEGGLYARFIRGGENLKNSTRLLGSGSMITIVDIYVQSV